MRTVSLDSLPALPAAAGAVCGILAPCYPSVWVVTAILFTAMILLRVRLVPALLFIVMTGATAALTLRIESDEPVDNVFDGRERLWRGTVESVRSSDRSQRCVVAFDSPAVLRCRMVLADITPLLVPGDIVEVEGTAESSRKYAELPSLTFGVERSERTEADMLVMRGSCTVAGHAGGVWYRLQDLRGSIAESVFDSPLDASTSRLLAASVFGGGDIGDDRKEAFRSAGLSHLLCVSGFHVAVFALVVSYLFFPLRMAEHAGRVRYLLIILAVWTYAAATGLMPSVFRAAVMISVYYLARLLGRNSPPFNSLCVSVCVILLVNPLWLFSIGFQLSVAAVAGLLIFADKFNPVRRGRRFYGLFALFAVPLAASAATSPVLLWHFHSLPLLAVPVNALASLIFPLFMVGGCTVVFLSSIGIRATIAAKAVDGLATLIDRLCAIPGAIDGSVLGGIAPGPLGLAALCGVLILLAVCLYSRRPAVRMATLGAAVLLGVVAVFIPGRKAACDLAVHGNTHSSEIRLRSKGRGLVIPLSGRDRPMGRPESYFLEGGVPEENIAVGTDSTAGACFGLEGDMLSFGGRSILMAANDSSGVAADVDILLLKARYRGELDSLIVRNRPKTVIIASDMKPERREAYAATALAAGLTVCDLTREIFYLKAD